MKRNLILFFIFLIAISCFGLFGCGTNDGGNNDFELQKFSNIVFKSEVIDYDGELHTIEVANVPDFADVQYENNGPFVDAGEYNIGVKISAENYKDLNLTAKLTINKIDITGITFEDTQKITYDGNSHKPSFSGTLPDGVTAKYYVGNKEVSEGIKDVGTYACKIILSGKNYKELILNCSYKIKENLIGFANKVIESFGQVPDLWEFLPEIFSSEYHTVTTLVDYSNFVNVSSIPKNGIGKQMDTVYGLLNIGEKAISVVNKVYAVMNSIKSLYSAFIDTTDEEKDYSNSVGNISFAIEIKEDVYYLNAELLGVKVKIYSNGGNGYGARVQLTNTTVLKYTVKEDYLLVALDVLDSSVTQIEFVRKNKQVCGYLYETIFNGSDFLSTSSLVYVEDSYTIIIGNKGDFILTSEGTNCEVYSNTTGTLVGSEVREILKGKAYNTLWYNLYSIGGITNIKKEDKKNGSNADTIYINNASKAIHSKNVSLTDWSRRFDIEFKTMYFYSYNEDKEEYDQVKIEIPMVFIQEDYLSTFIEDFSEENEDYLPGNITLNVNKSDKEAVSFAYSDLLSLYDEMKSKVTYDSIKNYCKS